MGYSDNDCREILQHLLDNASRYDPEGYEWLSEPFLRPPEQWHQGAHAGWHQLLVCLDTYIHFLKSRGPEAYRRTLGLLNEHVDTVEGDGITGIQIVLSPQDRNLYGLETMDLPVPDEPETLLEGLLSLQDEIRGQGGHSDESAGDQG